MPKSSVTCSDYDILKDLNDLGRRDNMKNEGRKENGERMLFLTGCNEGKGKDEVWCLSALATHLFSPRSGRK